MFFQIRHYSDDGEGLVPPVEWWDWQYRQGTAENPGEAMARNTGTITSLEACRTDIARARKAFSGARYAKVIDPT